MGRSSIPNVSELDQYRVNRPGQVEGVRQTLYDFQLYPTAGQAQLSFFQLPQGQGLTSSHNAVVGSVKTKADTNMESGGVLPNPKSFLVESIEIVFIPGSSAAANTFLVAPASGFAAANAAAVTALINDVNLVLNTGFLDFFIGSKSYLTEGPINRFPTKTRVITNAALATTSATAGEIFAATTAAVGRPYMMDPPVLLEPTQNFNVTLNWPAVVATPSGFNGRVGVILDGILYRNSQ